MSPLVTHLPSIDPGRKEVPRINRPTPIDLDGLEPHLHPYATLIGQIRQAPGHVEGSGMQTIGVIGCHTHDNASQVCQGLAETATLMLQQPVLLVETRNKKQSLFKKAKPTTTLGHNEFLAGDCTLDECIRPTPHKDLFHLPASVGAIPARAFNPSMLKQGVERCRSRFAVTFFDLAMLDSATNNYGLLTTHLDGVILVIAPNRTRSDVVRKCTLDLSRFGATLLGAVVSEST